jgi:hypothetical protein
MTDLKRTVLNLITAEVNELPLEDIIAKVRLNESEAQRTGAVMTGMGCKFCLTHYDELQDEGGRLSEFECDLKECLISALVYPILGVLQSVELGVDISNATVTLTKLTSTLQTVFSEHKSRELAQLLMVQLEASREGSEATVRAAPLESP